MLLVVALLTLIPGRSGLPGRTVGTDGALPTVLLPAPTDLRVENLAEQYATISVAAPRFSFQHGRQPSSLPRGTTQASYRLTVAAAGSSNGTLLWDTQVVASARCSQIEYTGAPLPPFGRFVWTAQWTASGGHGSSAVASSSFETGPMASMDWKGAAWVHNGTQLRAELSLPEGAAVVRGRAYVAAVGCHALLVNGQVPQPDTRGICPWPVGGGASQPLNVPSKVRYLTHNITHLLQSGKNVLGLLSGHVMVLANQTGGSDVDKHKDPAVGPAEVMAVVMVELTAGQQVFFATTAAASWMQTPSFVTTANAWATAIDWRSEVPDWATPSYQAEQSAWTAATLAPANNPPQALAMPTTTVLTEHQPVSVQKLAGGAFLYSFAKNFVGTVRLAALPHAESGSVLTLQLGEWLDDDRTDADQSMLVAGLAAAGCANVSGTWLDTFHGATIHIAQSGCALNATQPPGSNHSWYAVPGTISGDTLSVQFSKTVALTGTFDSSTSTIHWSNHGVWTRSCPARPCAGHPGRTFCPSINKPGQCDQPSHPACPPCNSSSPRPAGLGNRTIPMIAGDQQQYENHTLRAGNPRPLEVLFCWHGFQYVLVRSTGNTSFTGTLTSITGLEIRTNLTRTGWLSFGGDAVANSSHAAEVLNGIDTLVHNSHESNVAAYLPTDCPTREKHGWLGDALDASEEGMWNYDMAAVHHSYLQIIEDSAAPNGDPGSCVPSIGADIVYGRSTSNTSCSDIAWSAAFPVIANLLHEYYGDTRAAKQHWPALQLFAEGLINVASQPASCRPYDSHGHPVKDCHPKSLNGLAVCDQFGDWLAPHIGCGHGCPCWNQPSSSKCMVSEQMGGFGYILVLRAMAAMAAATGEPAAVVARYSSLAANATAAYHSAFWNSGHSVGYGEKGGYGGDIGATQTLTLPPLALGAAPDNATRAQALANLQHDLDNVTGYHLRVGAVTSKLLLNTLSDNGLHSSALKVATQITEPSWGWWLSQNATTCFEAWPGATDGSTSRNHIFLCGGVGEWMWKSLVGLSPTAPGFATVRVAPRVDAHNGPSSTSARFLSPRGEITVAWNISLARDTLSLSLKLPIGVEHAVVKVPTPPFGDDASGTAMEAAATIREGGEVVWDGSRLVGSHAGIYSASAVAGGVEFAAGGNAEFVFASS